VSGVTAGPPDRLDRRLGFGAAVVLGLGAMLGAGVYGALGPAAAAAGGGLLAGLVVAAAVAACNATSSARLAARDPTSGGAYAHAGRLLGPAWGFAAGWAFVAGKLASCAAMALVFGAHVAPDHPRPVAVAAVVACAAVNHRGVVKTVQATAVILTVVLAGLLAAVVAALWGGTADAARLGEGWPGPAGVLAYYALANASALRLPGGRAGWGRAVAVAGIAGCLAVAGALPPATVLAGAGVLAAGLLVRAAVRRAGPGPRAA
jgi:APA family basic amino acid/polyamine antiporter